MPKSVLRAILGRMQFTVHATRRTPHGASRLVRAMSAWLVKTRRAPSRHSRDTRVYGHKDYSHAQIENPPSPTPLRSPPVVPWMHHAPFGSQNKTAVTRAAPPCLMRSTVRRVSPRNTLPQRKPLEAPTLLLFPSVRTQHVSATLLGRVARVLGWMFSSASRYIHMAQKLSATTVDRAPFFCPLTRAAEAATIKRRAVWQQTK